MSQNRQWDFRTYPRPRNAFALTGEKNNLRPFFFTLSEKEPIHGIVSVYSQNQEALHNMHYELELGVVCSGRMQRHYDGWKATLGPGDVWFCGIWEPHSRKIIQAPCKVVVLVVLPQMLLNTRFAEAPHLNLMEPFTLAPEKRPRVHAGMRKEMLALGTKMAALITHRGEHWKVWLRLLLMEVLLKFQKGTAGGSKPDAISHHSYKHIHRAIQLTFQSRRVVTVREAARACGMSHNAFDRLFQELMGVSFAKFGLGCRIKGAAAQLLCSGDPIKAIATEWGFSDVSHLYRWFHQYYGCSPAEYRIRSKHGRGRLPFLRSTN